MILAMGDAGFKSVRCLFVNKRFTKIHGTYIDKNEICWKKSSSLTFKGNLDIKID